MGLCSLPHLHRDRALLGHIGARTGLSTPHLLQDLARPVAHRRRDWSRPPLRCGRYKARVHAYTPKHEEPAEAEAEAEAEAQPPDSEASVDQPPRRFVVDRVAARRHRAKEEEMPG